MIVQNIKLLRIHSCINKQYSTEVPVPPGSPTDLNLEINASNGDICALYIILHKSEFLTVYFYCSVELYYNDVQVNVTVCLRLIKMMKKCL